MKTTFLISQSILLLFGCLAQGQSTFVYDQQSSDESRLLEGSGGIGVTAQSFTPTLSQVGFVRVSLFDAFFDNGGGTLFLTLRGQSISGPVQGISTPVVLPTLFSGFVDFIFANPVTVTPETTYYFTVNAQSGGGFSFRTGPYNYDRGTEYFEGNPITLDVWFREGIIVVPEPSSASLLAIAAGILYRRIRSRK